MARERWAIIGTGIAGLGCAHFLHPRYDLTLFEQNGYVGGHTNTIDVASPTAPVSFDTGFMVFNKVTYPLLTQLFEELSVPVKPTDMSFSVQYLSTGLEYCGSSLNHLFAQRRNLLRPSFYRLLSAIARFNKEAVEALGDPAWQSATVGEYVGRRGYGQAFLDQYLVPMSSAVWSTPPSRMLDFPAMTLIRFFHNHGFLGLYTQHPWWTVDGGAREYVRRVTAPFAERIRLSEPAVSVRQEGGEVEVRTSAGERHRFDRVILACHGDEGLRLLAEPTRLETELLGEFHYQPNLATVHTDERVMPRTRLAWSSWNYRIETGSDGMPKPQTIYWMNRLQGLTDYTNYFVSIGGEESIAPEKVVRTIRYTHPLFSRGAIGAQERLPGLNVQPDRRISFCGSYFRYGFHEDAFGSAVALCRTLLGELNWPSGRKV